MLDKKRRARRRPENLVRLINITGVSVGVSMSAVQEHGEEPHVTSIGRIEFTGMMEDAVGETGY
jgi:hypothetical protein